MCTNLCCFSNQSKPQKGESFSSQPNIGNTSINFGATSSMPEVRKISTASEFKIALDSAGEKNVIVDFYATWCGPCKKVAPLYQEIAKKYKGQCVAVSVDVDEAEEVAEKCGVTAMPTFQVYKTGNKIGELIGAPRKDQLEHLFTKAPKK